MNARGLCMDDSFSTTIKKVHCDYGGNLAQSLIITELFIVYKDYPLGLAIKTMSHLSVNHRVTI